MNSNQEKQKNIDVIISQCAKYAFSWDSREKDSWLSVFAKNGIFELYTIGKYEKPSLRIVGQKQLSDFAEETFIALGETLTNHCQSSLLIDKIDQKKISSRIKVIVTHFSPEDEYPRIAFSGTYHDTWVYKSGVWKIGLRAFKPWSRNGE